MLKAVSSALLNIKFDKTNPPPAPGDWVDWFSGDTLLDQTAVAGVTKPKTAAVDAGATKAGVEVVTFDQKFGVMLTAPTEFEEVAKVKNITR